MYEIDRVREKLMEILNDRRLLVCILHSEISLDQQMQVYAKAEPGYRKVIISTTIAESSLTVPDVKYVIDFCLTKRMYTDPGTLFSQLQLEWAAKSNLTQRMGRAGRVKHGICFRLIPFEFYLNQISDFPEPSILREPLDKLVLNLKRYCKDKKPTEMLALAITPPPLDNIERTILGLKEAGALTLFKNKEICVDDGDLTYAGLIMASLPTDIRLGKLIIFGHCFGKLKEAIIIAAGLSVKSIFYQSYKSKFETFKKQFYFANGLQCDFNAILNAYNFWKSLEAEKRRGIRRNIKKHLEDNGLDYRSLRELETVKRKIEDRLKQYDLVIETEENFDFTGAPIESAKDEEILNNYYLIKLMVAGAFYPNYYKTNLIDEKNVIRDLSGRDPHSTVCVKGFETYSPVLYHTQIKNTFKACADNLILHYEGNKAFIEFKDFYKVTNKIANGVYFSLKLNSIKINAKGTEGTGIYVPPVRQDQVYEMERRVADLRRDRGTNYLNSSTSRVTTGTCDITEDVQRLLKDLNEFKINIIGVPDVNVIWASVKEEQNIKQLESIEKELNSKNYELKIVPRDEVYVGNLVVAFTFSETFVCGFYRARIIKVNQQRSSVNVSSI
jgi:ATP-dependent RNA helicase TDRD9